MDYKVLEIDVHKAEKELYGELSAVEVGRFLPFEVKRVYYIYGVKQGCKRGFHAHKTLRQMLICPYGSIRITMDDGCSKESVLLDSPSKGLLMGPGIWRDMKWIKDDSVLMVLASEHYDEADYIRDYDAFLQYAANKK